MTATMDATRRLWDQPLHRIQDRSHGARHGGAARAGPAAPDPPCEGGLTLDPLLPAWHDETLLMKALYAFHPDFVGSTVWWGDPKVDWGLADTRLAGILITAIAVTILVSGVMRL